MGRHNVQYGMGESVHLSIILKALISLRLYTHCPQIHILKAKDQMNVVSIVFYLLYLPNVDRMLIAVMKNIQELTKQEQKSFHNVGMNDLCCIISSFS